MGLGVLDAHHAAGPVGDRLRQPEQIGAPGQRRVVPVGVVVEELVDQPVEPLPTSVRVDGDDLGAAVGGVLDEIG
ncbi:hypothetical protein AU194_09000 [Mycobacterium sp. GA-2829]|nr:hypothetical protein AU194_09000 [Mycobacterium sp. GA-2829]